MTQQQPPVRRPRPQLRTVRVSRVDRITPHMVRITVGGDDLEGFTTHGPAEHIKVFFPTPGRDRPVLPTWGPEDPVYVPGPERPTSRTYTPRRWRPQEGELEIDFVLHSGGGPGSNWAERAQPGDILAIAGPSAPYRPDPDAEWHLVAGDDSALPAIGNIVQALPRSARVHVFIEVGGASEEQPIDSDAQVQVTWLHRSSEEDLAGRQLEAAIWNLKFPDGDGRVWLGCEASVMRDIRRHLLTERGLPRGAIHTQGYWKYSTPNHPDHDLGEDV